MTSPDLTVSNVAKIAELFPSVVTESLDADGNPASAVDFDLLRQELSDHVVEGPQERYQLDWPGKRAAIFAANAPIAKTLRPVREESVDFDVTQNLFIEGDNLDALKLLQESYLGKIKLIYIDPPYNTGNDFLYDDDFAQSTREYLLRSGRLTQSGERLVANPETNGRFHSDWLSMMAPRLKVARNLLRPDGLIMVSISDAELANLTSLMAETFGAANHVATFTWIKKRKGSHLSKTVRSMTEYVVCFARDIDEAELVGEAAYADKWQPLAKRTNAHKVLQFPEWSAETTLPDGRYAAGRYGEGTSALSFQQPFEVTDGMVSSRVVVEGPFVWGQDKLDQELALGSRVSLSKKFGFNALRHDQASKVKRPSTLIDKAVGAGTNEDAYEEAIELFGAEGIMSYPKPTSLLKYLIRAATWNDPSAIVMDFFAGSASVGQAVMQLNAETAGSRTFVLVQLGERCAPGTPAANAGYATIADVAKERLRRSAERTRRSLLPDANSPDVGFRVLKVDTTNMSDVLRTPDDTDQQELAGLGDSVKPGRSGEDLLFQVLLDWGLEVTVPITAEKVEGSEVFVVDDGALVACFDDDVTPELVRALAKQEPLRVVFRDSGFDTDAARINAEQIFKELSPATDVKAF